MLLDQKNVLDVLLDNQERNYCKWANPQVLNLSYDIEKLMGIDKQLLQQIEVRSPKHLSPTAETKPCPTSPTVPRAGDLHAAAQGQTAADQRAGPASAGCRSQRAAAAA